MQVNLAEHVEKNKQIQLGCYYTPKELVDKVYEFIKPYRNSNAIIFDSAGGCGAFLEKIGINDYRIAEYDSKACDFLKQCFDKGKVFHTNSLINVTRQKYNIPANAFLIVIGNPPYNDTTSEFKNGEKGKNICDEDLFDRDLGVSFLKSYNKLDANIVCILHPLSYLIKGTNFKRLRDFKRNNRLIKAEIFSSALFHRTGTAKFPIVVALYEKNASGMTFDYIKEFPFSVLNSNKEFILSRYKTTDGYINKYPPRKNDIKESPIGLYYYTFRDFNSLKKNTAFMLKKHYNSIVVTVENFFKYAYLYSLKVLFNPEDSWLYGNLSPLANIQEVENDKKLYVSYAIETNAILKRVEQSTIKEIMKFYNIETRNNKDVKTIETAIKNRLSKLV